MDTPLGVSGPDLTYVRTADGVTLAVQDLGRGPVLVWLPSLGHIRAQWRVPMLAGAYEHLARSLRLVLYDGRGTGSSDRRVDLADLGLDAHVRDLDAVVDAVAPPGRGSVALLGWYQSVPTALAYGAAHPDRVSRLVLFGGAPRMRDAMSPAQTQALLSLVDQDWDLFTEAAAHAWLGGFTAGASGAAFAEAFRTAATPAVASAWFANARAIDVTDLLPRVRTPTLVLHRQAERQIPVEVSRRLAESLPRATLVELTGSTPTLFLEDAHGDLDLVTRFVTRGDAAPGRPPAAGGLTAREREVLRLLAGGGTNAAIGRRLGITEHTVERHAANLYRKIDARGRADAVAWAMRHGMA